VNDRMRDESKHRRGLEGFRSGGPLDEILPGPALTAAVIAAAEEGDLSGMSLNALTGLLRGTQKAEALLAWCRRRAEAEYVRRGSAWDPSLGEEVLDDSAVQDAAQELLLTGGAVERKLRMSRQSTRLTECMRLLHDGKLRDDWRMTIIEQVTEHHLGALRDEVPRMRLAHPPRATGDQRHLPVEPAHRHLSCRSLPYRPDGTKRLLGLAYWAE